MPEPSYTPDIAAAIDDKELDALPEFDDHCAVALGAVMRYLTPEQGNHHADTWLRLIGLRVVAMTVILRMRGDRQVDIARSLNMTRANISRVIAEVARLTGMKSPDSTETTRETYRARAKAVHASRICNCQNSYE
jgi:hypothetical protein